MSEAETIAGSLTEADRECLLDLPADEPWRMGNPSWKDHECRRRFYDLRLVDAKFPDAKPGDSGLQHWRFNGLGLEVRRILQERSNG